MYTKELLSKYKYFKALNKFISIEYMIDPLTGLISRKYMLEFIKELINEKTEFTLSILDLDNFKDVNDTYGHTAGDIVLENIGNDLINFLGDNGIAGRYGGDEFLIIIFNNNEYDDIHKFYQQMFHGVVLRKTYEFNNGNAFITGTVGSAAYPTNATNFDDLFQMCDKTLYRGKMKGRNCFIIYVHEKHKDLQIQEMVKDDEATIFFNILSSFFNNVDFKSKVMDANAYLKKTLRLDYIFYVDNKGNIINLEDNEAFASNIDLSNAKFKNELINTYFASNLASIDINLAEALKKYNINSTLITRLRNKNGICGYLMYALERTSRIWQSNEVSILLYLASTLTIELS